MSEYTYRDMRHADALYAKHYQAFRNGVAVGIVARRRQPRLRNGGILYRWTAFHDDKWIDIERRSDFAAVYNAYMEDAK